MKRYIGSFTLTLLLCLLFVPQAFASLTDIPDYTPTELAKQSDIIAVGTIVDYIPTFNSNGGPLVYTINELRVDYYLGKSAESPILKIKEFGGDYLHWNLTITSTVGESGEIADKGEQICVFLKKEKDLYRLVSYKSVIYLDKEDGEKKLSEISAKYPKIYSTNISTLGYLLIGVLNLLVGIILARFYLAR